MTDGPTVRPHHRHTNVYSHTFSPLWEHRRKLIAHQCSHQLTAIKTGYPLTGITWLYRGLRCRPIKVEYFLQLSADNLFVFKWLKAHVYFFKNSYQICCVYVSISPHYQTDLRRKNSASFFKIQAGKTFSYHGHVLVTLQVQFLCSDCNLVPRAFPSKNGWVGKRPWHRLVTCTP